MPETPLVLIVDDDADNRDLYRLFLKGSGYAIETALNGIDALAILDGGVTPDLILLDWMMPQMDGPTFLVEKSQRKRFAAVPVVIVSASPDATKSPHAVACLSKPLSLSLLLSTVRRILGTL